MKLIKIINGTYGYRPVGSKMVDPKQAGDPPFEVDDSEAQRLISLGVATIVVSSLDTSSGKAVATPTEGENSIDASIDIPPVQTSGKTDEEDDQSMPPEYSVSMSAADLRELLAACGLTFRVGMTKADMVAALDEYYGVGEEEVEDDEAPPTIVPENPVV